MIEILTIVLGALIYTVAYLYCLGLRIIRQKLDDKLGAVILAFLVGSGILTATVTLEAVRLVRIARPASGSLFYIASVLGILLAAISAAGILGVPRPIEVALAHRRAAIFGGAGGNVALLVLNVLSFAGVVPSVL